MPKRFPTCFCIKFLLALVLSSTPLLGANSGDFVYTDDGVKVTITGYTGTGGSVTIPPTIAGLPVREIGTDAFRDRTTITSFSLPDSLTILGTGSLRGCTALTGISLPGNLTSIGINAFRGCTGLFSISIPASVTLIDTNAFRDCTGLRTITMSNGLATIQQFAFYNCSELTGIAFPASLGFIGTQAFRFCTKLASITLPNNLQSIGDFAFQDCNLLTTISNSGATGTNELTIGISSFSLNPELANISLPLNTKTIGAFSFADSPKLASISIPGSVTEINERAFQNNPMLTSVFFLGNAPNLGDAVFFNASAQFTVRFLGGAGGFTSPTWFGNASAVGQFPSITSHPQNKSIPMNTSTVLTVTAAGDPAPSLQWYSGNSGNTGSPVPGATGSSFTTPVLGSAASYWVRASNPFGMPADSSTATISIAVAPPAFAITTQPVGSNISSGSTAMMSVATNGTNPTYQWYRGTSGDASQAVGGATSASFTTPALSVTTSYWVRVTDNGVSRDSSTATVNVSTPSASLSALSINPGTLTPGFNAGTIAYVSTVPDTTASIRVTATSTGTITVNGATVASGVQSNPINLNPGSNTVTVVASIASPPLSKTYTINVTRAQLPTVTTDAATLVTTNSAKLKGTLNPNGNATVYFEYGTTTAYGIVTPVQIITGNTPVSVEAALSGLPGGQLFHYRFAVLNGGTPIFGQDRTFTTASPQNEVITLKPYVRNSTSAKLIGAVRTYGSEVEVFFEYGTTLFYGNTTTPKTIPAGKELSDVFEEITGLVPGVNYNVRLIAGGIEGNNVKFKAQVDPGNTEETPSGAPTVSTGSASSPGTKSVNLSSTVNPNGGYTIARFEYSPLPFASSPSLIKKTEEQRIGSASANGQVSTLLQGLTPDTTYYFRITALNSFGTSVGAEQSFRTNVEAPKFDDGEDPDGGDDGEAKADTDTIALSTTGMRISGNVRASASETTVEILYGTNRDALSDTIAATPSVLNGYEKSKITADLLNLRQDVTYYFQIKATNAGGSAMSKIESFRMATLSGRLQGFPPAVPAGDRQASLRLNLTPTGIGAGWRLAGEQEWRLPGTVATGMTNGDRIVEYRPVAGHIQPANETVAFISGNPVIVLDRSYTPSGSTGSGGLTVNLNPSSLADPVRPVATRLQWRLLGQTDSDWKNGGVTVTGLLPGNQVIELKPVAGRSTPPPASVVITNGASTEVTLTYFEADAVVGALPLPVPFADITNQALPYAFVGQIRSNVGSSTGFVVRPRVVATAAHVLFDDSTLSSVTGLQWLYQRYREVQEPTPLIPRAYYTMTGYAAQRAIDNSPGISTPESQHLDAAAMFFNRDAGRAGFSGYLASDLSANEFLQSPRLKTLVGYPVESVPAADLNKIHATTGSNIAFTLPPGSTRTYTTTQIRSTGGSSGAPLCVLDDNGKYYPAGIYLGGSGQTIVRAIDTDVTTLFGFAEVSGDSATGTGKGSITDIQTTSNGNPALGSLKVIIEPEGARTAGAGWRIQTGNYLTSGDRIDDLDPNTYSIEFSTIPGFEEPASPPVVMTAGELRTVTFTYEIIILPPVITSASQVSVDKGEPLQYQITATNSPDMYNLSGLLPSGTVFDPLLGRVTGTPQEAGRFPVFFGVSNDGGTDTRAVDIISLPIISPQSTNGSTTQALNYQITSGESGAGVSYGASGLPSGLSVNPTTGLITGTPSTAGTFSSTVSATVRGATKSVPMIFNISGSLPSLPTPAQTEFTVGYGENVTLSISPIGDPPPSVQWYAGSTGDTSQPVLNATSSTFVTPPLSTNSTFWARATNLSGAIDSPTFTVTVLLSANANLSFLGLSSASLSPAFSPGRTSYTAIVPNSIASVSVTPNPSVQVSTVKINGTTSPNDQASTPIALSEGNNTIAVQVAAQDGTLKDYVVTVTRAAAPVITTLAANGINDISAIINGSVTPNGNGTVFFEYGPTTSYGSRIGTQQVSGTSPIPISVPLAGLLGSTTYNYRIGFDDGGTSVYGGNMSFTTNPPRAIAVTGDAGAVNFTGATLIGIVNPKGTSTDIHFEYGTDPNVFGSSTPVVNIGSGIRFLERTAVLTGLTTGNTYYFRVVAVSSALAQPVVGETMQFTTQAPVVGGSDGLADNPPIVVPSSESASNIGKNGATLQATVNPNDGTTVVMFEYGTTPSYGFESASFSIGNGTADRLAISSIDNLEPGRTYFYRVVAENSKGVTFGTGRSFTTLFDGPSVTTGQASSMSTQSVRVNGIVRANGTSRDVYFRYGTDGTTFPQSVRAFQQSVGGPGESSVYVDLTNLDANTTYFYKLVAADTGQTQGIEGAVLTFNPSVLIGIVSQEPRDVPSSARQGRVTVNLLPSGTGSWRFSGEQLWRESGTTAIGLAVGDRTLEFRPVQGFIAPPSELITISDMDPVLTLDRLYYETGLAGTGSLQVTLLPATLAAANLPEATRSQWRLANSSDQTWKNSGAMLTGLREGTYLVECKAVAGWDTPVLASATVTEGMATIAKTTYFAAATLSANPPVVLTFDTTSSNPDLAYAHVGQIRSQSGSYSGFVVKPRVVATVAQAVFDDATLSTATGIQWLLQRDKDVHEPKPIAPRGTYFFTGYDTQRISENTPGVLSPTSQDLNVAALYFLEDAGRGGFSGFLGSNDTNNEFLISSNSKILAGYPVNQGRMHATPPNTSPFAFSQGKTFVSTTIRGTGGMAGGPLCVQYLGGAYYPAGIYLGGTSQGSVRAIDSTVIDLLTRAEVSGNGGDNNTGGGISQTSITGNLNITQKGSLKVVIEPADAASGGGAWQLMPESVMRQGGAQKSGLTPGRYNLKFAAVPGFFAPTMESVTVTGGQLTTVTFTYVEGADPLQNWRYENFGSYAITTDSADDQDPDKDGVKNIDEFTTGTNPRNASDVFQPSSVAKSGNTFTMTAAGKEGRVYTLHRTTTLDGTWSPVTTQGPLTVDGTVTLSDTAAPVGAAFYRIEVTYPAAANATPSGTPLESWRLANFQTASNTGDAADDQDPDKDGAKNIDEYTAGTNPNSSADFFRLNTATKSGNTFTASCAGKAGRTYTLQRNPGLSGMWTDITSQGPLASDAAVSLTDTAAPTGNAFYRIQVSLP